MTSEILNFDMTAQTFTLTFGDRAENHKGMQIMGEAATEGFTLEDLMRAQLWFQNHGVTAVIYDLRHQLPEELRGQAQEAYFLHAPSGVSSLVSPDELYHEQNALPKDTQAFMYGRVVNKKARHNLCFGPIAQEPNYEQKQGRVVAFDQVPLLNRIKEALPEIIGAKGNNMMIEGNYYYDINKCYIGYHGDSERKKVIAARLGASFPLHYQWFYQSKAVGNPSQLVLNHGDIYVMSEKAVGSDWKRRSILTLRHAAGDQKHLKIKK